MTKLTRMTEKLYNEKKKTASSNF